MDSSLVSTNSPPSGGTGSFLKLYHCPVTLIFTHLWILSGNSMCLLCTHALTAEAISSGPEPRESITAEKHRFVTGAKPLFMCASLWANQLPANKLKERVPSSHSSHSVEEGWRTGCLGLCRRAPLECMRVDDFPKILDGTASALQLKVPFMICLGMGKTCDFKMPITKKWETS